MGLFSWLTSDTEESILHVHSGQSRTVFLLQPDGKPPIEEPAYEGYGDFGGIDAYVWLVETNLPADRVALLSHDEKRAAGISLAHGDYYRDVATGAKFAICHQGPSIIDPEITHHAITYAKPVPGYDGKTYKDLLDGGHIETCHFEPRFPLKFSFNRNAVYEELPAAKDCPNQGYPGEDDETEN